MGLFFALIFRTVWPEDEDGVSCIDIYDQVSNYLNKTANFSCAKKIFLDKFLVFK